VTPARCRHWPQGLPWRLAAVLAPHRGPRAQRSGEDTEGDELKHLPAEYPDLNVRTSADLIGRDRNRSS
jgi:hypothetical protein